MSSLEGKNFYVYCDSLQPLGRMTSVHMCPQLLLKAAVNISEMHRRLLWQLITGFLLKRSVTYLLPDNTVYYKMQRHRFPIGFRVNKRAFISQTFLIRPRVTGLAVTRNVSCSLLFYRQSTEPVRGQWPWTQALGHQTELYIGSYIMQEAESFFLKCKG